MAGSASLLSVVLLALAFNAKELTYYLIGVLPMLAVLRGRVIERVRRNLVLGIISLLHAGWFIGFALFIISEASADTNSLSLVPESLTRLIEAGLSLNPSFMGIWQASSEFWQLRDLAWFGCTALLVVSALAGLIALWRADRPTISRSTAASFAPELYVMAVLFVTMIINARSSGAEAYYLLIPYWAALVLGLLLLRRLWLLRPWGHWVAVGLSALFVAQPSGCVSADARGTCGDHGAHRLELLAYEGDVLLCDPSAPDESKAG
jgi:hypothetical protein